MAASRELQRQLRRIEPCLPRPAKTPPAGPGWIHEIKHDGSRILAERDAAGVSLRSRKGFDFADRFQKAAAAVAKLPAKSSLIGAARRSSATRAAWRCSTCSGGAGAATT